MLLARVAGGQDQAFYVIEDIQLEGNKRTKAHIIYRELDLSLGDTVWLAEMADRFEFNRLRILSTGLFSHAQLNVRDWNTEKHTAAIQITLQENWYLYPSPIFDLADRSFAVWWREQGRDWGRVNYGLRLTHLNLTGNHDRLKFKLQFGYTRKYEAKYRYRYLKQGGWGLETKILFAESKEIGYATLGNKTLFHRGLDDRVMRQRFQAGVGLLNRPNRYFTQSIRLDLHSNWIDADIAQELNPAYFGEGRQGSRMLALDYHVELNKKDYAIYPQRGYALLGQVKKEGVGIFGDVNLLSVRAGAELYASRGRWIVGTRCRAKANLTRGAIPFANNTGLGYGKDLVRGYELYVIDGSHYGLARSHLSVKIWDQLLDNTLLPIRQFKKMDVKAYLRWTLDLGYVNEPSYAAGNPLANEVLLGYGPALDVVLFNLLLVKFEYNINRHGESGFFIKTGSSF